MDRDIHGRFLKGNTLRFKKGHSVSIEHRKKLRRLFKKIRHLGELKKGQWAGDKNPRWKGGRYKDKRGYVYIYQPNHPFAYWGTHVFEHRFVVEKQIGRYLTTREKVHHLDKEDNNNPNMLMCFINHSAHKRFEQGGVVKPEEIVFDGRKLPELGLG